jgi:DNA-binding response OmpR family regulator
LSRPKVLVVEDEPDLLEVFCLYLTEGGFEPLPAPDGVTAYRRFETDHPQAILLDLNVPQISGFRLLQLFRQEQPNLPILVTTGYSFEEAEEVASYRIDDFLTKPFDFSQLILKLNRLLGLE